MRLLIASAVLLLAATPAHAGELFGGVYKHAVDTPFSLSGGDEKGEDRSVQGRLRAVP